MRQNVAIIDKKRKEKRGSPITKYVTKHLFLFRCKTWHPI